MFVKGFVLTAALPNGGGAVFGPKGLVISIR